MKSKNTYINGSTALAPERDRKSPLEKEKYEKLKKSKIERANRLKMKKNVKKRKAMLSIASVFIVGFGLIWGEAQVYGTQRELSSLKMQISEQHRENEDLMLQLAKNSNIESIKQSAENNLHMKAPDKNTFIYADLSKNYFSEEPKDNTESKAKEIIDKVKNLLF